jgi:hypothetical protein
MENKTEIFEERLKNYYDKRRDFLQYLKKEYGINEEIIHTKARGKITLFDKVLLKILKFRKIKVALKYFDN